MKYVWLLLVMVIPVSCEAQSTADWKSFRSLQLKFEIRYPQNWSMQVVNSAAYIVSLSPQSERTESAGLKPSGSLDPWVQISRSGTGNCRVVTQNKKFEPLAFRKGDPPDVREITVCEDGIVVNLGFWEKDPNKKATSETLLKILDTFKKTN